MRNTTVWWGMTVAAIATAAVSLVRADGQGPDERNEHHDARSAYSIGLWGDLPYSAEQALVGVPNLIADMNHQRLAFSIHNGDLKQGSNSPCDDALYQQSIDYFNSLESAAMFTPGDNDWTDCDRPSNGGYVSLERLEHERLVMFGTPYSLGRRPLRQAVQSAPLCLGMNGMTGCVENRRWTYHDVTYATLNVAGSCNNLCDTDPNPAEFAARNAANIQWLKETFAEATTRRSVAVMLIAQANPGFDLSDPTRAPLRDPRTLAESNPATDGFKEFLSALRVEVVRFRKPVAYVHGDSHYFRIDRPFQDAFGRRLENFTRVETFGNNPVNGTNDVQWLKVSVDPRTREVFSYEAQIVPGNRVAVPAP